MSEDACVLDLKLWEVREYLSQIWRHLLGLLHERAETEYDVVVEINGRRLYYVLEEWQQDVFNYLQEISHKELVLCNEPDRVPALVDSDVRLGIPTFNWFL